MAELSYDDQVQLYRGSVVEFEGGLVYVRDVDHNQFQIIRAGQHLREWVGFNMDAFKAPKRIGYVNYQNGALFVSRVPRRLYCVGLRRDNVQITCDGNLIPPGYLDVLVEGKGIIEAYQGKYPTLYKAFQLAKASSISVAFDKQFAIDHLRNIYFKGYKVGIIPKGYVRKVNIQWDAGYEFCEYSLSPDYEKTVRTFANQ